MKYDRTVIAYHGCDADIADRLIAGEPFRRSRNDYDWLGEGIYFWEFGQHRALQFALEQKARGKLQRPAVVGALIQLGRCFDLMDTRFTGELKDAFEVFRGDWERRGALLPTNGGNTPDLLLRRRDCAVINYYLQMLAARREEYDTVRCGFIEDAPAYEGSGISLKSHIQLSVRNHACIIGAFRPSVIHEQRHQRPPRFRR